MEHNAIQQDEQSGSTPPVSKKPETSTTYRTEENSRINDDQNMKNLPLISGEVEFPVSSTECDELSLKETEENTKVDGSIIATTPENARKVQDETIVTLVQTTESPLEDYPASSTLSSK